MLGKASISYTSLVATWVMGPYHKGHKGYLSKLVPALRRSTFYYISVDCFVAH